jgi:hypothetical protein
VTGYHVTALDGEIGRIEDFVLHNRTWSVRYVEIDTRPWWPGSKKVLLARQWIEDVSWEDRKVRVDVGRSALKEAPEYEEHKPISEQYELALFKHYGRELDCTE